MAHLCDGQERTSVVYITSNWRPFSTGCSSTARPIRSRPVALWQSKTGATSPGRNYLSQWGTHQCKTHRIRAVSPNLFICGRRCFALGNTLTYHLYRGDCDMRKSFDGLCGVVRTETGSPAGQRRGLCVCQSPSNPD
jgi:hypothetical protein